MWLDDCFIQLFKSMGGHYFPRDLRIPILAETFMYQFIDIIIPFKVWINDHAKLVNNSYLIKWLLVYMNMNIWHLCYP